MRSKEEREVDAKLLEIEKQILAAEIAMMQQKLEQRDMKKEAKRRGPCTHCDCKVFVFDDKKPTSCSYCGCLCTDHLKLKTNIDSTGKKRGLCQKKECSCAQFVSDADKLSCESCSHKAVYHRELAEEGISNDIFKNDMLLEKVVILFHGTSKESAKKIIKEGFVSSTGGQLGCGTKSFSDVTNVFLRCIYGERRESRTIC